MICKLTRRDFLKLGLAAAGGSVLAGLLPHRRARADGWQNPPFTGDIPSPRFGHSIVEIDGLYYLFGGQTVAPTTAGLRPLGPTADLYRYDPNERHFARLSPGGAEMPSASPHCAVEVNGRMYVMGGAGGTDCSQYMYDPVTNILTEEGPPPLGERQDMGAAAIGGLIYVTGGRNVDGEPVATNEMWRYDVATQKWAQQPNLITPVYGANLTAHNGNLYLFGGRNADGDQNGLYEYNPAYGYWEPKVTNAPPDVRAYAVGAPAGNQWWIAGGSGGSSGMRAQAAGELQDIWTLDLDTFQWTRHPDAPASFYLAAGVVIPYPTAGRLAAQAEDVSLFIFGGLSQGAPVNTVAEYYTGENPPPGSEWKIYLPLVLR